MSDKSLLKKVPDRTIFFDGVCVVCNRWVDYILKRDNDGLFRFGTLQSDFGRQLIESRPELRSKNELSSMVLIENGEIFFKSTAMFQILMRMRGWSLLARMCLAIPCPLRDFCYDIFGWFRYAVFGKLDICRVPTDQERDRFID